MLFIKGEEHIIDSLDKLKYFLKKFRKLYQLLLFLISPVYSNNYIKKFIQNYVNENVITINLGSGNTDLSENITNIDLMAYENVDLTCDIENIPIKSESFDYIISCVVLEHVKNPYRVVEEMHRLLKKNGMVCCYVPFIVGFHASPFDFHRFTYEGMKLLFKNFDIIELKVAGGPTSGLLWILQEWLALLLSLGSKKLHFIFYILLMVVTFPLKFLDILFVYHPLAKNVASSFYILAQKK